MRFEVNVDDGDNLSTLHAARQKYNEDNAKVAGFVPADDMPTFVQRLVDGAVSSAMEPIAPTSLSSALTRVAQLEADKATLTQEVAALTAKAAPAP